MSITLQKLLKTTLYIFHTVTVRREMPFYPEKKSLRRKDFIWYSLQKPTSYVWSALPGSFFFNASTIHAYLQFWCLPLSKGKIPVSKPLLNTSSTVSLVSSLTLLVRLYSHHWKAQNIKHTYTYIQKPTLGKHFSCPQHSFGHCTKCTNNVRGQWGGSHRGEGGSQRLTAK